MAAPVSRRLRAMTERDHRERSVESMPVLTDDQSAQRRVLVR